MVDQAPAIQKNKDDIHFFNFASFPPKTQKTSEKKSGTWWFVLVYMVCIVDCYTTTNPTKLINYVRLASKGILVIVSLYCLLFFSIFLPDEILVEFQAAFPQSTPDSTGQFWPAAGDYSGFQKTGSLGSPTF